MYTCVYDRMHLPPPRSYHAAPSKTFCIDRLHRVVGAVVDDGSVKTRMSFVAAAVVAATATATTRVAAHTTSHPNSREKSLGWWLRRLTMGKAIISRGSWHLPCASMRMDADHFCHTMYCREPTPVEIVLLRFLLQEFHDSMALSQAKW